MKWGVLGGTFDPIHNGHLRCAQKIYEMFNLCGVMFVPTFRPPHKYLPAITPYIHRKQMVKAAIEGTPGFSLFEEESQGSNVSYAVHVIQNILNILGSVELYFILGQDAFQTMSTWKDLNNVLSSCHFIVMNRPGYQNRRPDEIFPRQFDDFYCYDFSVQGYKGRTGKYIYFRDVPLLDISASDIRLKIKQGKSIDYLVPDKVRTYISTHGMYHTDQPYSMVKALS